MKILWFTWKDKANPLAGGAEMVNEELAARLVADGHEVIFLVGGFSGSVSEEVRRGFKIIRLGSRWTVYLQAYKYYKKNLVGWADLVIDEINTIPFFCKFYVKEKNILFIHQLCREIWFYEMFFPLSLIGYLLEPIYLWLLHNRVITISQSTKDDLIRFGFNQDKINIISEGIEIEQVKDLESVKKYEVPTILSLGSIRAMKRTDQIIQAFTIAKGKLPNLRLIVAGYSEGKYGQKILRLIKENKYKDSIEYLGQVSTTEKIELMQKSHLICVTSVKEGWGLIVTEAGSQGTPALVYNVDGLRDAVMEGEAGFICNKNNPEELAKKIVLILQDSANYQVKQTAAYHLSTLVNFENSYHDFIKVIE
jgi:glycosyltransferase involved in cell wall biosynthesis